MVGTVLTSEQIAWLIFAAMLFCHFFADYNMQGILAQLKQKQWWHENAPAKLYRYDYIAALFAHSFMWSFIVLLPPLIYMLLTHDALTATFFYTLPINTGVHMLVDDFKANRREINLIEDQLLHIVQLFCTWLVLFFLL